MRAVVTYALYALYALYATERACEGNMYFS
jgi:hypothetical protein